MAFPSIGLSAVFDVADFMKNANAYDKKVSELTGKTSTAATTGTKAMASLGKGIATGMAAGAAALVGVGAAVGKLVSVTKDIPAVSAAFEGLGGSIETMRQGSLGMVTDIDLMKSYNSAAQLVSKEFAEDLGPAMQYLSKVSAATGQDMGFMIDSLVKGVGRLSPMILDNLGIQVNATEANDAYAKSLGISAEELTKSQQQTAMMNLVMEKLKANTADMPPVIGTSAQAMASFQTTLMNVRNELGTALIPIIAELQTALLPIAQSLMTTFSNPAFKQGVVDAAKFIAGLVQSLLDIEPIAIRTGVQIVALGLALPKLAVAFTTVKTAVMALNLVIAANPIGAIAIAIVAAGIGIVKVIDMINDKSNEVQQQMATQAESVMATAQTYEQYKQSVIDTVREERNLPVAMTDSVVAMHLLEDGLIRTEANFNAMRVSAAEVGPALQGIGMGAEDMRTSMSVAQSVMEDSVSAMQEMPPAFHDIESAAAGTAKAVGHWRDVADEGFTDINNLLVEAFSNSAEFKGMLDTLSKTFAQHMQKMVEIEEDGLKERQELEFEYQMDMAQAEGEYQAQRLAIQATGDAEALAQLDAKFAQEQEQSAVGYAQQQDLQSRSLLQQRLMEQQSYVAALEMQRDAMIQKLYMMLYEAANADGIISDREQGILDTVLAGASAQLKAEIAKGQALLEVAQATAEGQLDIAATTAAGVISIFEGDIAAGKAAIAETKAIMAAQGAKMLADTGARFANIGVSIGSEIGSGISSGAKSSSKTAKKDATAVVADVAADVAKAVEAAKKTMVSLEELVFTPEMMAGWDQMGEMLKTGAKKMFEWLQAPDMKKMLKEVAEFQESIMAVFGMAGAADVGGLSPKRYDFVDQATAWANDVALWSEQMIDLGRTMVDSLLTIKGLWSGTEIEDAANLTPQVSLIFEMLGSAADAMATFSELVLLDTDNSEERLVIFGKLVTSIITTLVDVSKTLDADAVDAAARILDSSVTVVDFITPASEAIVSLSEFIASDATLALDNLEGWSSTIKALIEELVSISKDLGVLGVDAAAKVFSSATEIAEFVVPAVEALSALGGFESIGDISGVGEGLGKMVLTLVQGLEAARIAIGLELEPEALALYADVEKVLGVVGPALDALASLGDWAEIRDALGLRPSRNDIVIIGLENVGKRIGELILTLIVGLEKARDSIALVL
ncbi:MAG TPA: hypothetical protein VM537_12365, partial [Anaerolineae bacterium]|nr:hypothetical protein [Anaerolineae bacterium]